MNPDTDTDNDGLAAETRRLLDAATQGPWEACTAPHPDDDKTPAEWLASCMTGEGELWCVTAPNTTDDGYGYLVPAVTGDGPFSEAHAALIAAAPRLLANWLAREEQHTDENRALREQLDAVERLFSNDPDSSVRTTYRREWSSSNGDCMVSSQPVECAEVPLDDLRSVLAAADRGVTDGDRNEGDEE